MRAAQWRTRRFARVAWFALVYNVLVVLWGAFVRASLSGDGCGSHWPLCNGEIIPTAPEVKTLIEFSHRVMSGAALALALALAWAARRLYARQDRVRSATRAALILTITEALIGAGLVVFGLVADDDSVARAVSLSVHLVNTFLLLGALALAAWWASWAATVDGAATTGNAFRVKRRTAALVFGSALGGMLLLGVSGAIAALGDTLFPSVSLAHAWRQDFSGAAHLLIRLRVLHPVIAALVGALLLWAAWMAMRGASGERGARGRWTRRLAYTTVALVAAQMLAGGVNVLLLAPVWMQIVHLLLADLLWIAFVLLTATLFAFAPAMAPKQSLH